MEPPAGRLLTAADIGRGLVCAALGWKELRHIEQTPDPRVGRVQSAAARAPLDGSWCSMLPMYRTARAIPCDPVWRCALLLP